MKLLPSISIRWRVISSTMDGIVQEPPAAEGQKIPELPCIDTKLMLILAAENADEESIVRELDA